MKKICPFCFCGRVTTKNEKPYKLKNEFKDCSFCKGTGILEKEEINEYSRSNRRYH